MATPFSSVGVYCHCFTALMQPDRAMGSSAARRIADVAVLVDPHIEHDNALYPRFLRNGGVHTGSRL